MDTNGKLPIDSTGVGPGTSGVQPFLPSGVETMRPPPSYDEVMGHSCMTSIKPGQTDFPALSYIDIMPRCTKPGNLSVKLAPEFDKFSALIDGANHWLRSNTEVGVWKCETVERKVEKSQIGTTISMDSMTKLDSMFGFNVWVKGIRLWLIKKTDPNLPIQQLGLLNFTPAALQIPISSMSIPIGGFCVFKPGMIFAHNPLFYGSMEINTFETLQETIKSMNKTFKNKPIQGTILNVETTTIKACEGFKQSDLDPEKTCWTETKTDVRKYTQIIRVFYLQGQQCNEEIELTNFVPDMTSPPEWPTKPATFETMPFLVNKVARWLPSQQGRRILNIQSQDVKVHIMPLTDEVAIGYDSTDDIETTHSTNHSIKVIRVFHTKSHEVPPTPTNLTSRLFVPLRIGRNSYETMSQTMFRIDAWLKVTGLQPYNVETVQYLFSDNDFQGVNIEKTDYKDRIPSGKIWVIAIRLYFAHMFEEPPPSLLPATIDWKTQGPMESSCCTLL